MTNHQYQLEWQISIFAIIFFILSPVSSPLIAWYISTGNPNLTGCLRLVFLALPLEHWQPRRWSCSGCRQRVGGDVSSVQWHLGGAKSWLWITKAEWAQALAGQTDLTEQTEGRRFSSSYITSGTFSRWRSTAYEQHFQCFFSFLTPGSHWVLNGYRSGAARNQKSLKSMLWAHINAVRVRRV